jgi:hypothetical protein
LIASHQDSVQEGIIGVVPYTPIEWKPDWSIEHLDSIIVDDLDLQKHITVTNRDEDHKQPTKKYSHKSN